MSARFRDTGRDLWLQRWRRLLKLATASPLLPLNRPRRLAGDVVGHAVDAVDLVDDARRHAAEELVAERVVVGRHAIGRRHRSQGTGLVVGPAVAHHAHGAYRQQYGEGLPDLVVEP